MSPSYEGSETRFSSTTSSSSVPSLVSEPSTHVASPMLAEHMDLSADEDDHHPEKHSYSCKRCRRLKKKCSRTKPECQNCNKSGELCEYVPRAPRRKKAEILKSLDYDGRDTAPQQTLPSVQNQQLPSMSELTALHSRRQLGGFSTFDQLRPSLPPLSSLAASLASRRPHLPPTSQADQSQPQQSGSALPVSGLQHAHLSSAIHAPASGFSLDRTPTPIPHDLLIRCVDRFYDDYGKTYPFLDHIKFCETYNPLAHAFQEGTHFEVNMAVFLGYLSLAKMKQIPDDIQLKEILRVRALGNVSNFIHDESVNTLKKLMYYAMYTLMEDTADASWYVCGMVTRMAISLGINRSAPNGRSDAQNEEVHRLFWSCYNFDRVVSVTLGRPEALIDSDIDVPSIKARAGEDSDLIQLLNAICRLRTIEGMIMKDVHSPSAAMNSKGQPCTAEEQLATLQRLRLEIEAWYNTTSVITCADRKVSLTSCTTSWYSSTYYHLLSLIYRPSFLIPSPSKETLALLGRCCLQAASFTYNLHSHHPLPMHWVQLHRLITHCTTMVYCLTHSCVDLVETKAEVNLCIQLLEHFSREWPVCAQVLDVFRKISTQVYHLRLKPELMTNPEDGIGPLFRAVGVEYCDVLVSNEYEVKFDEPAIKGIREI